MGRALGRLLRKMADEVKITKDNRRTISSVVTVCYLQHGWRCQQGDASFEKLARRYQGKETNSGTFLVTGVRDISFEFKAPSKAAEFLLRVQENERNRELTDAKDIPRLVSIESNLIQEFRYLRVKAKSTASFETRGRRI